jgi:small subunit ribosomal protein S15
MALDSAKKLEIAIEYGASATDTGSPAVQIALLTYRIIELTEHLKTNKKDHSSRLGLLKLVSKRKALMKYLKRKDYAQHNELAAKLSIRIK